MKYYNDNSLSIGNTPLVRINHLNKSSNLILAKIEGQNPAYSVKCRIGASMIWDAEKKNLLGPGKEIIEATSGNTGIALAFVAAARGYKVHLTMPENMSKERKQLLQGLGANIILTHEKDYMSGAINKAKQIVNENPKKYFMPMQFENPANPKVHETTTGPEVWKDTEGKIDILVAGVGTGGTITGISRYIKNKKNKKIFSVAVEPKLSPVIKWSLTHDLKSKESKTNKDHPLQIKNHVIQGIGAGFVSPNLDLTIIDDVVGVDDEEAIFYTRKLASKEGILAGISSGAAICAALKISQQKTIRNKVIVVIFPDIGERYLSSGIFSHSIK